MTDHLPGADLIQKGLSDLENKKITIESLLVLIGAPKLEFLGIKIPDFRVENPEQALYIELDRQGDGAHSKYNALIRKLVSFERSYATAS